MIDAAFQATFSDFRTVKGRKVCQIILEVPIEQANAALRVLGGVPDPSSAPWVAVARLKEEAAQQPSQPPEKPKRRWEEMKPSEQAGIACGDAAFSKFIAAQPGSENTAGRLREILDITSRRDLDHDPHKAVKWSQLYADFLRWSGRQPEAR